MTPARPPVRTSRPPRLLPAAPLLSLALLLAPAPAEAFELSTGVSVGGILAGATPRFALSPNVGLSLRTEAGFLFAAHDVLSILVPINGAGAGFDNRLSAAVGYATENSAFSIGPSLSVYLMPVCSPLVCGQVLGLSPGAQAQAEVYLAGPLGVAVTASAGWMGGRSYSLSGGVAAMVIAGPVLRWTSK